MKTETLKGQAVLRQPGAVMVRTHREGVGVVMVRVELPSGASVALGSDLLFEKVGSAYTLTGGG